VAASLTMYASDPIRIWFAGGLVGRDLMGRARHRGQDEIDEARYAAGPVDFANGSSLFARREVIEKVGGLDDDYFLYWEDVDWCTRAAEAGWRTWFVPGARVWHDVTPDMGAQWDRARLYDARNRMLWLRRHHPGGLLPALLATLAAIPWLALTGRGHEGSLQWRGVVAFLRGSRGRMDA